MDAVGKLGCLIGVAIIAGGFLTNGGSWHGLRGDPVHDAEIDRRARTFVVRDARHRFEYGLSESSTWIEGIVAMTGRHSGVREGGALRTIHWLDDGAARRFHREHRGAKRCPAPFFNRQARQTILFASDQIIQRRLARWDNDDYGDVGSWQRVRVRGRCLTGLKLGERDGAQVTVPYNMFDRCLSFHVDRMEIGPQDGAGLIGRSGA